MMMPNLSRLLMVAGICVGLAGCGDSGSAPTPQAASTASSAADNKKAIGGETSAAPATNLPDTAPVVKVVTTGKTRPLSFTDSNGSVAGFDIDVITKIGEVQGFKVQFHKRPWQMLFSDVETKQNDLAISGISYTNERAEKYALSDSYAINQSELMFLDASLKDKVKDLKSLKYVTGLRVGALDGSKHAKQLANAGITDIKTYKTTYLLFTSLLRKETDVVAQDGILLNQLAKEFKQPAYTVVYEKKEEPSAQLVILMAKDNEKLRASVNEGLAKIKQNGELAKIQQKWLTAPNQ